MKSLTPSTAKSKYCNHTLKLITPATGSQKARSVCTKCKTPFAFYAMSLKQTEDYVNQYYREITYIPEREKTVHSPG